MSGREELQEQVAEVLWDNDSEQVATMTTAGRVLDAILPQVSTVAELEALPFGSLLLADTGRTLNWAGIAYQAERDWLATNAPVTVVWQP